MTDRLSKVDELWEPAQPAWVAHAVHPKNAKEQKLELLTINCIYKGLSVSALVRCQGHLVIKLETIPAFETLGPNPMFAISFWHECCLTPCDLSYSRGYFWWRIRIQACQAHIVSVSWANSDSNFCSGIPTFVPQRSALFFRGKNCSDQGTSKVNKHP